MVNVGILSCPECGYAREVDMDQMPPKDAKRGRIFTCKGCGADIEVFKDGYRLLTKNEDQDLGFWSQEPDAPTMEPDDEPEDCFDCRRLLCLDCRGRF